MDAISPIPALPARLREAAALKRTLVPFVGAGASVLAGCPNWSDFADAALRYFVRQGKFSYGQLAQVSQQSPRVKLSIALGLQREHKLPIDFVDILYPQGRNTNPKGRKLYETLCKLGNTFVTTNYDDWLDTTVGAPAPAMSAETEASATSPIRQKPTVIYKVEELTLDNLERPNRVFHLHGSLLDPTSMILHNSALRRTLCERPSWRKRFERREQGPYFPRLFIRSEECSLRGLRARRVRNT